MANNIRNMMKEIALFNGLDKNAIHFLSQHMEVKIFNRGEEILRQGELGSELFIIVEGGVEIDVGFPGDISKKTAELGVNQIFGEVSFLSNLPVTASVYSKAHCKCLILSVGIMRCLKVISPNSEHLLEKNITHGLIAKIILNIQNTIKLLSKIPHNILEQCFISEKIYNPYAGFKLINEESLLPELLNQLSFMAELKKEQRQLVMKSITIKSYQKGCQFSMIEPDAKRLLIIYSGAVMKFIKKDNQLYKSIAVLGIGDLFTQNCLFREYYDSLTHVACENCTILELNYEDFEELYQTSPPIYYLINKYLHRAISNSVYITNRQHIRLYTEYKNFLS